jgi:hypothetical protein
MYVVKFQGEDWRSFSETRRVGGFSVVRRHWPGEIGDGGAIGLKDAIRLEFNINNWTVADPFLVTQAVLYQSS